MKILKALYERLIRLIISVCLQIPWVIAGWAFHFYAYHTFPDKIQNAFGLVEAEARLAQATQSTAFMKNMISVSNPVASINYLTSLVQQTMAWSRLNSSQMFVHVGTIFSLWLVDAFLFIGAIYLIWRTYKIYRQKGRQKESAQLVSKELAPYFNRLQNEIQGLRQEILTLKEKNGEGDFTDSLDTRG